MRFGSSRRVELFITAGRTGWAVIMEPRAYLVMHFDVFYQRRRKTAVP